MAGHAGSHLVDGPVAAAGHEAEPIVRLRGDPLFDVRRGVPGASGLVQLAVLVTRERVLNGGQRVSLSCRRIEYKDMFHRWPSFIVFSSAR